MKYLHTILKSLSLAIGFFLFLSVPVGLLRGEGLDVFMVDEFNVDPLAFTADDDRLTDIKLIDDQQEEYFLKNGKYLHVPEFACLAGRCQVDEYRTYVGQVGYVAYFYNDEKAEREYSAISKGVFNLSNDWEAVEK
jgi:hypothetical protein